MSLVVGVLMAACTAASAWASGPDARSGQVLVTEFAGKGVAEFFLTPDLPRDWALMASELSPGGDGIPDVCQKAALFPELMATGATTLEYSINGAASGDTSVAIVGLGAKTAA